MVTSSNLLQITQNQANLTENKYIVVVHVGTC